MSACALRPGACGGDVEEGLRLPQLSSSLRGAGGGLGVAACEWSKNKKKNVVSHPGGNRRIPAFCCSEFTCLWGDVGGPDFSEGRDSSAVGAEHRGTVDVKVGVRCAVQRAKPLSCGCFGLGQLQDKRNVKKT